MIEWLAVPLVVVGAAFIPKSKITDKKKIDLVFRNRKAAIKQGEEILYPKLKKSIHNQNYITYLYSLPFGFPSEAFESIIPALKEALTKEIEYEFKDGFLKIDVFETNLPERWDYDESLIRPGTWEVPIGQNHKGIIYHDFDKYPAILIGGVARFGKTVAMKTMMNTLIMNNPDDIEIYILDLKAGLEFYKYNALPQVKAVACDVYESAALLHHITQELKEKEVYFRENNYTNIVETPIRKRTFVLVDEGAELSPEIIKDKNAKKAAEYCQGALSEIARIGQGLGLRLLFATQYPTAQAVPMQVKMNIVTRLSFICASNIASKVLLDQSGAEDLPAIPGRAIYLVEKKRVVQVPFINDNMMQKIFKPLPRETRKRKNT